MVLLEHGGRSVMRSRRNISSEPVHKVRSLYETLCSPARTYVNVRRCSLLGAPANVWFQSFSRVAALTDDKLQLIYDGQFPRLTIEMTALQPCE